MTKKQIIINAAIIILVPTVVSAGWYGYKAYKHYRDKKRKENEGEIPSKEDDTDQKEAKVIPLNTFKPTIEEIENNTEKTEKQA